MDLGLKGKTALVTGSSRGLGYATALLLAQEGVRVAVNSRSADSAQKAAAKIAAESGSEVIGLPGDLGDPRVPAQLVSEAARVFGGLDILVTNAGGPPSGPFEAFDDDVWQKAIDTALMAHVRLIRNALPHLRKSAAPAVLTVTSYSAKQPIPNLVLSNSLRAAMLGLTKSLALELGKDGIRFNSILPAFTETERITELYSSRAKNNSTSIEDELAKTAKDSALGRISTPEEFARPAVFLVSPAASYLTGVMLSIDGGLYKGTL